MKPMPAPGACCPPTYEIDAWAMMTYVRAAISGHDLGLHLLACPRCLERVAKAWVLLPDPDYVSSHMKPCPDLSFLELVSVEQ